MWSLRFLPGSDLCSITITLLHDSPVSLFLPILTWLNLTLGWPKLSAFSAVCTKRADHCQRKTIHLSFSIRTTNKWAYNTSPKSYCLSLPLYPPMPKSLEIYSLKKPGCWTLISYSLDFADCIPVVLFNILSRSLYCGKLVGSRGLLSFDSPILALFFIDLR